MSLLKLATELMGFKYYNQSTGIFHWKKEIMRNTQKYPFSSVLHHSWRVPLVLMGVFIQDSEQVMCNHF